MRLTKQWRKIVDDVLRTGGNEKNSVLRIIYEFMQDQEDHVDFIKNEYKIGGKGLILNGQSYAVWFDEHGLSIAQGDSALETTSTIMNLSWHDVCEEMQHLLNSGIYQKQSILDAAYDNAVKEMAEEIYWMVEDLQNEYREMFVGKEKLQPKDCEDLFRERLKDQDSLEKMRQVLQYLDKEYQEFPNIMRLHYHNPSKTYRTFKRFSFERKSFVAREDFVWEHPDFFITQDEIDQILKYGGAYEGGKFRIYSCFLLKKESKDRLECLKDEYGIGGHTDSNYWIDYNNTRLKIERNDHVHERKAVEFRWAAVAKRIDHLIQKERFLARKQYLQLHDEEIKVMARMIIIFYNRLPDSIDRPFTDDFFLQKTQDELFEIIQDKEKFQSILNEMDQILKNLPEDFKAINTTYQEKKEKLELLHQYYDGTYTIFPFKKPEKKEDVMEWTQTSIFDFI